MVIEELLLGLGHQAGGAKASAASWVFCSKVFLRLRSFKSLAQALWLASPMTLLMASW